MNLPPFEQVVADHGAVVLRVCRAVVGPEGAEDAWSETFLAALRAYPGLRDGSNIRGWLVTIAHRKGIDQLRATRRAPLPVDPPPTTMNGDDTSVVDADTELWAGVAALAPKQRAAVAYHYLADLPYAEIATLLETTEAAARRSAADGIAVLRRRITQASRERPEHDR